MNSILATVAICTRNRVKYLGPTIEAVLAQKCPRGSFEVLVVDNGSTDGTYELVTSRFGKSTEVPVRCVREEIAGLSRARNRAISETKSEFILFLDDDAIPEPGWLAALLDAFASSSDVAVVGGPVIPTYEFDKPAWLSLRAERFFSCIIPAEGLRRLSYPQYPYGANVGFRWSVFETVGTFREELGYCASKLIPAEETEFLMRVEKSGVGILYEPLAVVRHIIPPERVSKKYLRRRALTVGIGLYEVEKTRRSDFEDWGLREAAPRLWRSLIDCFSFGFKAVGSRMNETERGFDSELLHLRDFGLCRARLKDSLFQLNKRLGLK